MASECLMLFRRFRFLAGANLKRQRKNQAFDTPLLSSVELMVQIRLSDQLVKRTENEAIIVNLDL